MPKQQQAVSKTAKTSAKVGDVNNIDQREMVAREAYLHAEKRGFNGDQVQDRLEAEKKVNEMLNMDS